MTASPWDAIAASIVRSGARSFRVQSARPVNGGCINQSFELSGSGARFFVKLNLSARLAMFEAEAAGLTEIAATGTVRVPRPVCTGADATRAWLVLEHMPLTSAGDAAMARLGSQLAAMHRLQHDHFGWALPNTIGSTPQINTPTPDWVQFVHRNRLGYQLELAQRNSHLSVLRPGMHLLEVLPRFFAGYDPIASLLHGDLWGGNAAQTTGGEAVIFDPAVYYGDREADLAMTELFGGFSQRFYTAYRDAWPLDSGYAARRDLYNLYHVLNHLNLFGGSYRTQAEAMIGRLLSEVR